MRFPPTTRLPSTLASLVVLVALVARGGGVAHAGEGGALSDAVSAFEAGEWKKAAEAAEHVPDDAEDAPKAHYLLGEARLLLGDAAAAETAFRFTLEKRPSPTFAGSAAGRFSSVNRNAVSAAAASPRSRRASPRR